MPKERNEIHAAATFDKSQMGDYDRGEIIDYVKTMLDDDNVLYLTVLALDSGNGIVSVQTKLKKVAINTRTLDKVREIYKAMDGYKDTWILTESVMHHPEIYQ